MNNFNKLTLFFIRFTRYTSNPFHLSHKTNIFSFAILIQLSENYYTNRFTSSCKIPLLKQAKHFYKLIITSEKHDKDEDDSLLLFFKSITIFSINTQRSMKIKQPDLDSMPVSNYMFKVNNRNTRISCEIYSKLTIKAAERRHWCCSGVFICNFEYISHLVLVFLLLTLNM